MFVIDDDALMRGELIHLLEGVGYEVVAYPSANDFLRAHAEPAGVLVVDLRLQGISGLLLQRKLLGRPEVQFVFVSGVAHVEDAVTAMKAGAFEFLVKPFRPQALIDAVGGAFDRLDDRQVDQVNLQVARSAYHSLTETEREVAHLLASGLRNKQIAYCSGRAESTVKVHRARIMKKMGVGTLVDLARQLQRLGLT